MATGRKILEIYIKSIHINETGDRKVEEAQNTVMALLTYPRPGKAEVLATTGLIPKLHDDKTRRFQPPKLLLKEIAQGGTELLITVTDRDDTNQVVSLLRRLGSALLGGVGDAGESFVPGLFRAAFQEAVASGRLAVGDRSEDKIEVVAVGELPLHDLTKVEKDTTVELTAPQKLERKGKPPIRRGASNGQIDLVIFARDP